MQKEGIVTQVAAQGSFPNQHSPGTFFYSYTIMFADGTAGKYISKEADINNIKFKQGQSIKYEIESKVDKNGNQYNKIKPFDENKGGGGYRYKPEDIKSIAMSQAFTESYNLAMKVPEVSQMFPHIRKTIFDWLSSQKNGKLAGGVVKTTTLAFTSNSVPLEGVGSPEQFCAKWTEVANYIYAQCDPERFKEATPQPQQQSPQPQQQTPQNDPNSAFANPNAAPNVNGTPF